MDGGAAPGAPAAADAAAIRRAGRKGQPMPRASGADRASGGTARKYRRARSDDAVVTLSPAAVMRPPRHGEPDRLRAAETTHGKMRDFPRASRAAPLTPAPAMA